MLFCFDTFSSTINFLNTLCLKHVDQGAELLRLKDEKLKEKDSILRTLKSQDCDSLTLARKNQAQKAKLKNKVMISNLFPILIDISSGGNNQDAGPGDCDPEGIANTGNRK